MKNNIRNFQDLRARVSLVTGRFSWVLVLILGLWAVVASAHEYRYHYISLTEVPLPSGFVAFNPSAINDSGRVYGTAWDASFVDPHVAVYAGGAVTVLQPGNAGAANAHGTVGGHVTDPQTGKLQAALFRETKVEIIPFLPGEIQTFVVSLNNSDTALVWSEDPSGGNRNTYRLYSKGRTTFSFQLPTGSDCSGCWSVNNGGVVAGSIHDPDVNAFRAIQFRPPYGEPFVLDPLPTDSDSYPFGINSSGYILGSSNGGDPTKTTIGVWDKKGHFKTYFEGINYFAFFNDQKLLVLTQNFDTDFNSYLVPEPGVRVNVEDLVDNPSSVEAPLAQVVGINNHGDMIGYGLCNDITCPLFLLKRIDSE
jgi:hypothetical protein